MRTLQTALSGIRRWPCVRLYPALPCRTLFSDARNPGHSPPALHKSCPQVRYSSACTRVTTVTKPTRYITHLWCALNLANYRTNTNHFFVRSSRTYWSTSIKTSSNSQSHLHTCALTACNTQTLLLLWLKTKTNAVLKNRTSVYARFNAQLNEAVTNAAIATLLISVGNFPILVSDLLHHGRDCLTVVNVADLWTHAHYYIELTIIMIHHCHNKQWHFN